MDTLDKVSQNIQILANATLTATSTIPHKKITITYDASNNPTVLKYWKENNVQVGEVHITYDLSNNPIVVEKMDSFT